MDKSSLNPGQPNTQVPSNQITNQTPPTPGPVPAQSEQQNIPQKKKPTKKIMFFVLGIIGVSIIILFVLGKVISFKDTLPSKNITNQLVEIQKNGTGGSIKIPEGWSVTQNDGTNQKLVDLSTLASTLTVLGPSSNITGYVRPSINASENTIEPSSNDLKTEVNAHKFSNPNAKILSEGETSVNGHSVIKLEYSLDEDNRAYQNKHTRKPVHSLVYFLDYKTTIYQIEFTSGESDFTKYKPLFENVIDSFTIKSGSTSVDKAKIQVVADPCLILTKQIATKLLGEGAVIEDDSKNNIVDENVSITACKYKLPDPKYKAQSLKEITLHVRSPKNEQTAKGLRDIFGPNKEVNTITTSGVQTKVQNVKNLGDKAYFILGQVWILKNSNVYILGGFNSKDGFYNQADLVSTAQLMNLH